MNCKTKALIVGFGWGVSLLLSLVVLIALLSGLFMLGERIGINTALIVTVLGGSVMFLGVGKCGYDQYLEKCKEN